MAGKAILFVLEHVRELLLGAGEDGVVQWGAAWLPASDHDACVGTTDDLAHPNRQGAPLDEGKVRLTEHRVRAVRVGELVELRPLIVAEGVDAG